MIERDNYSAEKTKLMSLKQSSHEHSAALLNNKRRDSIRSKIRF